MDLTLEGGDYSGGGWGGLNIGSWETFAQDMGKAYLNTTLQAKYNAPIELEKMRLQAYSQYGNPYLEGIAGNTPGQIGGIPTGWILVGGAVLLAVVMLKD